MTFRLTKEDKPLNLKELFPSAILIHKKGNALYTINALNKLIEDQYPDSVGNTDNKNIKIDWEEYQDKLILVNNKELTFFNISRVF